MDNDQLFIPVPYLQEKHSRKRGMPKPVPAMHTADLTQAIIKYIKARGGYAVRINCFGMYDEKTGRWRKSTTERGTADIHACIEGKHISIEVKNGDDRMSEQQHNVQEAVISAGGIYLIIHEFVEFHTWYKKRNAP